MKSQKSPFGKRKDLYFMRKALDQAKKAYSCDEVPVGAIVINADGMIIGRGYNQVEKRHTQAAHAEIIAIAAAGKKRNDWRLNGCWLYVTLEPCAMCMNLAILSRLSGVVFGAPSPVFGCQLDKESVFQLYKKGALFVIAGVCENEAGALLQLFFRHKRGEKHHDKKGKFN